MRKLTFSIKVCILNTTQYCAFGCDTMYAFVTNVNTNTNNFILY